MSEQPTPDRSPERKTIRVPFPWHKTVAMMHGSKTYYRWRPGIRWIEVPGHYTVNREAVADGEGAMLLVEVGRYTPPGYLERVFYTRQFELPSGAAVGKPKLKVISAAGFTRLCRGYRYPVELTDELEKVEMEPEKYPDVEDYADAASY